MITHGSRVWSNPAVLTMPTDNAGKTFLSSRESLAAVVYVQSSTTPGRRIASNRSRVRLRALSWSTIGHG